MVLSIYIADKQYMKDINKLASSKWNLKILTDVDFLKKRKIIVNAHHRFIGKWQNRHDWLSEPAVLKEALDEFEKLNRFFINGAEEGYYYWLRSQVDENDTKIKAQYNQINNFNTNLENRLQFFELRLARVDQNIQSRFIKSPILKLYRHYLERLFAKAYFLLTEQEEGLMRLKSAGSYFNWVKLTSETLSAENGNVLVANGQYRKKSFSEILSLTNNCHKKVRDEAAKVLNTIILKNIKIGENELNAILGDKKINDELRQMKRSDLSRHVTDDIESKTVDSMIETVVKNFSLSKRYYRLKAQLLNVKKLEYHERNVPIGNTQSNFSYLKSCELLQAVLANLDNDFLVIFKDFVRRGAIDVYPRAGKCSGAFCVSESVSSPTFILLNHDNSLKDVLTLAHEVGHGINNELMRQQQNALNYGTSLATAEVASTFFEDFVLKKIIKETDEEQRLSLLMEKLNQDVNTIFRQAALYLFEKELHQLFRIRGYLNYQEIGHLFQKHMFAYMGSSVKKSPGSENWWLHWPHIRDYFYVYSYVSGLLISKYLQNEVIKDSHFVNKVKNFLAIGRCQSPLIAFSKLGINIADPMFWQKGLLEIKNLLIETEKLARKLGKI